MPQSAPPRSVKKLPDALSGPDLQMVALDYFRRLGHDNRGRLLHALRMGRKEEQDLMGTADRGLYRSLLFFFWQRIPY